MHYFKQKILPATLRIILNHSILWFFGFSKWCPPLPKARASWRSKKGGGGGSPFHSVSTILLKNLKYSLTILFKTLMRSSTIKKVGHLHLPLPYLSWLLPSQYKVDKPTCQWFSSPSNWRRKVEAQRVWDKAAAQCHLLCSCLGITPNYS